MNRDIVEHLIEMAGDNPNREGLKETPDRVVRMYSELFRGYHGESKPQITVFPNNQDGVHYDQMIVDTGYFYSHCEHHMVPFFGSYYFAYIPKDHLLGLSKVGRVVGYHAARLQVQERLTKEVIDDLQQAVNPLGIGLVLKGRHLCKEMRGVKMVNGEMTTSDLRGALREKVEAREEFMRFINGK